MSVELRVELGKICRKLLVLNKFIPSKRYILIKTPDKDLKFVPDNAHI